MSDDAHFRALFAEEARGQLGRLAAGALELERLAAQDEDAGEELVAGLFRDAHTLKSSAALVGLNPVGELAHDLEDLLGELRAGTRRSSGALADVLLTSADALGSMVEALLAGREPTGQAEAAHAALARLRADEPAGGAAARPPTDPVLAALDAMGAAPVSPAPALEELVPVALERLDRLVRLSGEAVAAESGLSHLLAGALAADPDAEAAVGALRRVLRAVQSEVLATRMTSLGAIAGPLHRAARDVARASGKEVDYRLEGERVQLDRAVLDGLRDPLLHLVRNAVDHGLEAPAERRAAGKPATGEVVVQAERRGREIVVTVRDDGSGLDLDALRATAHEPEADDEAAAELVFRAGLSTAAAVTDVSGRGVGMDAVRVGVEALRGRVGVRTRRGEGTTFSLTVPLTLAVVPCVLVRAGTERYALPTHATLALTDVPRSAEVAMEGGQALWHGPEVVPVSLLADVLGAPGAEADRDGTAIVLRGTSGERQALRVGAVLGQRDVTVRELGDVLPRTDLVAGAALEADGSVVCVLDAGALVDAARRARRGAQAAAAARPDGDPAPRPAPGGGASILVVDDALTVRELQRSILERAGHRVRTAVDGEAALALLAEERPDLVVCDVEMPRLDGFGLVRRIRALPALRSLPVLMVTSRGTEDDRRRGLEAGADAYLVKRDFDEARLLEAVGRLLGA